MLHKLQSGSLPLKLWNILCKWWTMGAAVWCHERHNRIPHFFLLNSFKAVEHKLKLKVTILYSQIWWTLIHCGQLRSHHMGADEQLVHTHTRPYVLCPYCPSYTSSSHGWKRSTSAQYSYSSQAQIQNVNMAYNQLPPFSIAASAKTFINFSAEWLYTNRHPV